MMVNLIEAGTAARQGERLLRPPSSPPASMLWSRAPLPSACARVMRWPFPIILRPHHLCLPCLRSFWSRDLVAGPPRSSCSSASSRTRSSASLPPRSTPCPTRSLSSTASRSSPSPTPRSSAPRSSLHTLLGYTLLGYALLGRRARHRRARSLPPPRSSPPRSLPPHLVAVPRASSQSRQ